MDYEWDYHKNIRNIALRGIDFAQTVDFQWSTSVIVEDNRYDYGEKRFRAMGKIDDRLHVVVFTLRGEMTRIISLRRANKREEKLYEKT